MSGLPVPRALLYGLATGEVVTLPGADGLNVGDELELVDGGPAGAPIRPPYDRWHETAPPGTWRARVDDLLDPADLDPDAFASRHLLASHPETPVAVLRVFGADGAVLSDAAFAARLRSIEGARR